MGALLASEGQIAFASGRNDDLDIYLLDVKRGAIVNLTHSQSNAYLADWSPDGTQLVYVDDSPGGDREIWLRQVGCRDLFSPCGANLRRLTFDRASEYSPAWSPDGKKIVFVSERYGTAELMLVDVGCTNQPAGCQDAAQRLTSNDFLDTDPAWSPDGKTDCVCIGSRRTLECRFMDDGC